MEKKLPKAVVIEAEKLSAQIESLQQARFSLIYGAGLALGIETPVADWEVDLVAGIIRVGADKSKPPHLSPTPVPSAFDAGVPEPVVLEADDLEADLLARDKKAGKK